MNLHEYQAKQLFVRYGLPVPQSKLVASDEELKQVNTQLAAPPWVMKCQVHAGGRGKAGGVKLIKTEEEALQYAKYWLGRRLVTGQSSAEGQPVNHILVEKVVEIKKELYFGVILDRATKRVVFISSTAGGMDIEQVAEEMPEKIFKTILDPLTGPQLYQGRELAYKLGLSGKQVSQFTQMFMALSRMFLENDLSLIEINPLAITEQGELLCLDAKVSVDNNALFRQKELTQLFDTTQEDPRELEAAQSGLSYVALDGNIGCLVNGAGLAMATMDMVKLYGGAPANFLDVGGSATSERVAKAVKIIISDPQVKVIFVNIFGGIVRCDLIAKGLIEAIQKVGLKIPLVVRLEGTNAELAKQELIDSQLDIIASNNLTEATQKVVAIAEDKE